jgi:large subunit ribosomal protein L17
MRHQQTSRRFDMPSAQRMAMFRNLTTDVLKHGYVRTTEARAKEVRHFVEHMVTLGKSGTVHSRRQALAFVYDKHVVEDLFDEIAPKYQERAGGYTRLIHLGQRQGDAARMARLELV